MEAKDQQPEPRYNHPHYLAHELTEIAQTLPRTSEAFTPHMFMVVQSAARMLNEPGAAMLVLARMTRLHPMHPTDGWDVKTRLRSLDEHIIGYVAKLCLLLPEDERPADLTLETVVDALVEQAFARAQEGQSDATPETSPPGTEPSGGTTPSDPDTNGNDPTGRQDDRPH